MKKTPLYDRHVEYGGKMVDFSGWALPLHYKTGIIAEHHAVRKNCGLFDVSHMGEIMVEGMGAVPFLQRMITNDIFRMYDGSIFYTPMCLPSGGVVDDLLIYRMGEIRFMLVVNAANRKKDLDWLMQNKNEAMDGPTTIRDVSDEFMQLAIQGPEAERVLVKLADARAINDMRFYHFGSLPVAGIQAIVSRTGYTGEDGFEIYVPSGKAVQLWDALMDAGREFNLLPAGLGARDSLRFEAALPLYGNELSENITPLEAGLNKFVRLDKEDFIGKAVLQKQVQVGLTRKLTGFRMLQPGIPRNGCKVMWRYAPDALPVGAGTVTTGGHSPTLDDNIGLILMNTDILAKAVDQGEGQLYVVVREKELKIECVPLPFYKKRYRIHIRRNK